jgi:cell division protease FtsH
LIDEKVRKLLQDAYALAKKIITDNRSLHEKIAQELLVKEEMTQDEFDLFFENIVHVPQKIAM